MGVVNLLLKRSHPQPNVTCGISCKIYFSNIGHMSDLQKRITSYLKVYSASIVCHMFLKKCLKSWFHQLIWRNGTPIIPVSISKDESAINYENNPSLVFEELRFRCHSSCFVTMQFPEIPCFSMFQSLVILAFT